MKCVSLKVTLSQFQWITLEQAKHGMVHVRFTWLTLSSAGSDLPAVRIIVDSPFTWTINPNVNRPPRL